MKPGKRKGDGSILKDGYLLKQSDVLRQWHLRYFVLSKECLCYYRTEQESITQLEPPKGLIFFNDMSLYVEELPDKQTKYCLRIVKRSAVDQKTTRTFYLCCFCEQERNEWLAQILQAKAIALVVNPASWMDSNHTATNTQSDGPSDFNPLGSSAGSDVVASAKQVLRRYRRKLSLGSSHVSSTSFAMVDDLCLERRGHPKTKMSTCWRNTLADMSIQSIMV